MDRFSSAVLVLLFAAAAGAPAQTLLVDHTNGSAILGVPSAGGQFLTDGVRVGAPGETWVIDRIRVWGLPDSASGPARFPGDLFESITLRGGLWAQPPAAVGDAAAADDCGCHGLLSLASATLEPGALRSGNSNIVIAGVEGSNTWQVDFVNLSWSVPGGARLQIGVEAKGRPVPGSDTTPTWSMRGAPSEMPHQLYLFLPDGKPARAFTEHQPARMDIQIWGHRLATVSIARSGRNYEVTVKGQPSFDAGQIDAATLQFAGRAAAPASVRTIDANRDGVPDLVSTFSAGAAAIPPGTVTACLKGRLRNGDPFEGCDLLPGISN